jgi:hypothetical protein
VSPPVSRDRFSKPRLIACQPSRRTHDQVDIDTEISGLLLKTFYGAADGHRTA